jgi:hypothetical protein
MVNAKMIANIRQRTLLDLAVGACDVAAAAGGASAPGRCREALGRAMVRTSFIIFVDMQLLRVEQCRFMATLMSTIEGSSITV